jgi:hypothetical protein
VEILAKYVISTSPFRDGISRERACVATVQSAFASSICVYVWGSRNHRKYDNKLPRVLFKDRYGRLLLIFGDHGDHVSKFVDVHMFNIWHVKIK